MMKSKNRKLNILRAAAFVLLTASLYAGMSSAAYAATDNASGAAAMTAAGSGTAGASGAEASKKATSSADAEVKAATEEKVLTEPTEHVSWDSCIISGRNIVIKGRMDGELTPEDTDIGEDTNFYLLELAPYEDSIAGHRMIASVPKSGKVEFAIPYNTGKGNRLFNRFLVCVWTGSTYRVVSDTIYITNPEEAARYHDAYKNPITKKGLLIELSQVTDAFRLGVHNVIVNIPFDSLIGDGIEYKFEGETYHLNKNVVEAYDKTISTLSNKSMKVTAILLNRKGSRTTELIDPDVKNASGVSYYNFNAGTEAGYKLIKALASFLASRYSGKDSSHGLIQNWIIGNEINNQSWNYVGPMDVDSYAAEYERSFRVFYNAIKAQQANSKLYFSLDNNWNQLNDDKLKYTARATLNAVADVISRHGNIDWELAYHPYPVPMTEPEFWNDAETGQVKNDVSTRVINFANLSVLTDYMQQQRLLNRAGRVRHVILSEQGFTSKSPTRGNVEKEQAAAFAYAYYIADSNPYIDAFILSRQIDAPSELRSSLAFGLWTTEAKEDVNIRPYHAKYIWDVFQHIDDKNSTLKYTDFAKPIIGISKWSELIPNFKWRSQE